MAHLCEWGERAALIVRPERHGFRRPAIDTLRMKSRLSDIAGSHAIQGREGRSHSITEMYVSHTAVWLSIVTQSTVKST